MSPASVHLPTAIIIELLHAIVAMGENRNLASSAATSGFRDARKSEGLDYEGAGARHALVALELDVDDVVQGASGDLRTAPEPASLHLRIKLTSGG